jgi:NAD(P)-dependent dehydrogenase (short-subunit alcohol dehydrogenase family)
MRVLITGAAGGLGGALASAYAERGADVLRTDLRESGDVLGHDVTSDDSWAVVRDHVEQTWGGLDVLVNNAGIAGGGRMDVATMDEWQRLVDVNLLGVARGIATFTPVFKQQRSGQVVNIASLAGLVHPAGMAPYNATKAGVVALTETVGHELSPWGVTAHVVCPSYFKTGLVDSMSGSDVAFGTVIAHLVESSPLGPDDIAAAVLDGLDRGEELIVPDEAARAAYGLKQSDREAYDVQMRRQAAKLTDLPGGHPEDGGR